MQLTDELTDFALASALDARADERVHFGLRPGDKAAVRSDGSREKTVRGLLVNAGARDSAALHDIGKAK
jgi:hypothetical protein